MELYSAVKKNEVFRYMDIYIYNLPNEMSQGQKTSTTRSFSYAGPA